MTYTIHLMFAGISGSMRLVIHTPDKLRCANISPYLPVSLLETVIFLCCLFDDFSTNTNMNSSWSIL